MDKISVEILGEICNVVDDRVALKALRLVSKKLADIVACYLFKTLIIFQHWSSWHRLELIARCPRLAHLVKKLELVTMTAGDNTGLFSGWKRRSQGHRVEGHLRLGHRGAAVAELVEPLNDKLAVVLRLQQRYQTWLWWDEGQEALFRFAADFESYGLLSSLSLPALSEIETAWPPDQWISGPYPGRRERQGNLRLRLVDFYGAVNRRCNAHLSFALVALHDRGMKITTLELHQYREILRSQMNLVPILFYLEHLKLHFRHPFDVEDHQALAMFAGDRGLKMTLAPYLAYAENLENLIVTQDCFTDKREDKRIWSYDVIPILSTASWPELRSVRLGEVFTRSTHLIQFLMMYGNGLRSIHLDRPVRREIVWQRLASRIRTQCANPNCVISSRDNIIFRSNSACVEDSDRLNNEYDWPGSTRDDADWWASWL